MDLAAEHVDPEDLSVVVALSEGEAVALWCAIMAPHTEENLIDGVVGDLCVSMRVQQPEGMRGKMMLMFGMYKEAVLGFNPSAPKIYTH